MRKCRWKNEYSRLIKALRMSTTMKVKEGWSENIGAGFIKEDILDVEFAEPEVIVRFPWTEHLFTPDDIKKGLLQVNFPPTLYVTFGWGHQEFLIKDLNLRETKELLEFVLDKRHQQEISNLKQKHSDEVKKVRWNAQGQ